MQLVKPSVSFLWMTENPIQSIEQAGRVCYKSENKITKDSAEKFATNLLKRDHEAMIEHAVASYKVICDRGVTHEIVRHRLFSYAQESTRYCNYRDKVTFIIPCWLTDLVEGPIMIIPNDKLGEIIESNQDAWVYAMAYAETRYQYLLKNNWTPQQARSVLPNSLKTEIIITGNFREWRHFFKLRCAKTAHPQMQEVANMLLTDMKSRVNVIFERTDNAS